MFDVNLNLSVRLSANQLLQISLRLLRNGPHLSLSISSPNTCKFGLKTEKFEFEYLRLLYCYNEGILILTPQLFLQVTTAVEVEYYNSSHFTFNEYAGIDVAVAVSRGDVTS